MLRIMLVAAHQNGVTLSDSLPAVARAAMAPFTFTLPVAEPVDSENGTPRYECRSTYGQMSELWFIIDSSYE
jgi:hypothetical protein